MGSGLTGQCGIAEETTVGTGATPNRFYEIGNESVKADIEQIEYFGIRAGAAKSLTTSQSVQGKVNISGDIEMAVMNKGFGLIFKHALGAVATSTPGGATNSRDHKCTVGAIDAKGLTIQFGRPAIDGTSHPFTYTGCKIANWELSNDTSSILMLKLGIDGMAETTATGLASASYPSALLPFAFTRGVVTLAGSGYDVLDWTLAGDNGLATDRFAIRSTTPSAKKEQLEAGIREYTGTLNADFTSLTAYNRFINGTTAAITLVYTSTVAIESTYFPTITINIPAARFDGETPNIPGPELLTQALPFKVLNDGTSDSPLAITVRSVDTTP